MRLTADQCRALSTIVESYRADEATLEVTTVKHVAGREYVTTLDVVLSRNDDPAFGVHSAIALDGVVFTETAA